MDNPKEPTIEELKAICLLAEHMGEVLNGMDAIQPEDEPFTNPGYAALDRLCEAHGYDSKARIADYFAACEANKA